MSQASFGTRIVATIALPVANDIQLAALEERRPRVAALAA